MKWIATAAIAAMQVLAGASAQGLPASARLNIQAITQTSPNLPQYTQVDQPLLRDALQAASGGRVHVTLASWPERNVNGPEVLRMVRSGQVDIAAAPLTTVSGDVPLLDAFDLHGMNLNVDQARAVAQALMPAANKELERLGIKMVAAYPFSGQMLFCKSPVRSLADLKGLKVRVFGPSASDFFRAVGAQPVSLAFGEVYTALERGTVDCGLTGAGSGNGVKWPEVTSYLYVLPFSWAVAGYYVNLAWWNKLDAATRGLLEKTFAEIQDAQWALGRSATDDGVACNTGKAAGCKMHTLVKRPMEGVAHQPKDVAEIQRVAADVVLPGWIKRCGGRCEGVYNDVIAPITGIKYSAAK
jgi:TRAP-type C4-dicarboxylate transport system substrate-binding protein